MNHSNCFRCGKEENAWFSVCRTCKLLLCFMCSIPNASRGACNGCCMERIDGP